MDKERFTELTQQVKYVVAHLDADHPDWAYSAMHALTEAPSPTPDHQVIRALYLYEASRRLPTQLCEFCAIPSPVMEITTLDLPDPPSGAARHHAFLLRCGHIQMHPCHSA